MRFASLEMRQLLLLLFPVLVIASLVGVRIFQNPIKPWMHEEEWSRAVAGDPYLGNATLIIRGTVVDVLLNRTVFGYYSYHTFPAIITLNLTEAVWIDGRVLSDRNRTVISIGYDFEEVPDLTVGDRCEASGFWLSITDSAYSFKLIVAPSIEGSYIKPL